jgi:hypothetical protein
MPKSLLLIIIGTVKYVAGRQLLVHVGKNTITYNDILGSITRSADRQPETGGS